MAQSHQQTALTACAVGIDAVHLLVHCNGHVYRKLLAPDPHTRQTQGLSLEAESVHFIRHIRLCELTTIQFSFDFRITSPRTTTERHCASDCVSPAAPSPLNLLFHEYLQVHNVTSRMYVENMGVFALSSPGECYRYTTAPFPVSRLTNGGGIDAKRRSLRLEICDLERNAWFVGEWPVKMQGVGRDAREWLARGNNALLPSRSASSLSTSSVSVRSVSSEDENEFDDIDSEELLAESAQAIKCRDDFSVLLSSGRQVTRELIPDDAISDSVSLDGGARGREEFRSRLWRVGGSGNHSTPLLSPDATPDPAIMSHVSHVSHSPLRTSPRPATVPGDAVSTAAASFEDLALDDFSALEVEDETLSLPRPASPDTSQRLISDAPPTRLSSPLRHPTTGEEARAAGVPASLVHDMPTVDIFQQVGSLLFSTTLGQYVSGTIKSDPAEQHIKTSFSTGTIHLLGERYQLQDVLSNVLVMEEAEETLCVPELRFRERESRLVQLAKRISSVSGARLLLLREVLAVRQAGSVATERLKAWFEAAGWLVRKYGPAVLRIQSPSANGMLLGGPVVMEIGVFAPSAGREMVETAAGGETVESADNAASGQWLVELGLVLDYGASVDSASTHGTSETQFRAVAQASAFFVEMTAFVVQLELDAARRPPEIVLMESWNGHLEGESLHLGEPVPLVKYSAIPDASGYASFVYFWSGHLQAWLLQSMRIVGGQATVHPLINFQLAIQIPLAGCHVTVAQDSTRATGSFSIVTSRGQVFYFRVVQLADLAEIVGRIRFVLLRHAPAPPRARRAGSTLLEADRIYRGSSLSGTPVRELASGVVPVPAPSAAELERVRNANCSVMDAFQEDFRSRLWFGYRKGFARIEPSLFTTDLGWGCMLRTGQCLMAEALLRFHFGRNWRLWQLELFRQLDPATVLEVDRQRHQLMLAFYIRIVRQFADVAPEADSARESPYSVHRMAQEGAKIGTPIGQWFGPSVLGKVLKGICNGLDESPFWIHLAADGVFPTPHLLKIVAHRAALVLLPLRLGLDAMNPIYGSFVKGCLRLASSLGIVGGLPGKSLYFVGYQDWDLLFLDPHILKPCNIAFSDPAALFSDYHTPTVRAIPLAQIDPSMLIGFLCCSAEEVVQLRDQLAKLNHLANILSFRG